MKSIAERAAAINNVQGRFMPAHPSHIADNLFSTQTWRSEARTLKKYGKLLKLRVEIRFDDNCKNGFNSFAITGEAVDSRDKWVTGGCCHDEIAQVFPELAPLIRWHLFDTRGPLHYIANTVYLAGDRDCHGLRKGEVVQIRNGRTGELCWHRPHVAAAYADGPEKPNDSATAEWEPLTRTGVGKARELDAARRVAVWPEATDAELSNDPDTLRAALAARLPALLTQFRADIIAAGFHWEPLP